MASDQRLLLAAISGAALALAIVALTPISSVLKSSTRSDTDNNNPKFNGHATAPPSKTTIPSPPPASSLAQTIGSTPLVLLPTLSRLTNSQIYAKLELLNPGGSPKDRVARSILSCLQNADPPLQSGDTIYEGTVGSTGISLATLARSLGVQCHIFMPSDQSVEKSDLLRKLGARVSRVTPAPIVDPKHFVNLAREAAAWHTKALEAGVRGEVALFSDLPGRPNSTGSQQARQQRRPKAAPEQDIRITIHGRGHFADQFETDANYLAHYTTTGPEIYSQTHGNISAFVAGAGTGGTISGVGLYLKEQRYADNAVPKIILADPQGSGLYNRVKNGVFWSEYEREGTRRRSQVDTVIEGIGLVRSTRNWRAGEEANVVDDAVKVTDKQAKKMAKWLVRREGWFVGGSSAVNCVAALQTALNGGPGQRIVTIFCDSGMRHLSKFWAGIDADEDGDFGEATFAELEEILSPSKISKS